jgi:hypothetical protein
MKGQGLTEAERAELYRLHRQQGVCFQGGRQDQGCLDAGRGVYAARNRQGFTSG